MKLDMSLSELASFVPKPMPENVLLRNGDEVLVRFMRRNNALYRAKIINIFDPVSGEKSETASPTRSERSRICIKVIVEGDEHTERPIWPFQDHIYTYGWVNEWAGMEVAKPPENTEARKPVSPRMKRLLGKKK